MNNEESPLLAPEIDAREELERGNSLGELDEPRAEFLQKLLNRDNSSRESALFRDGVGPAAFLIRDAVLGLNLENPAEGSYDPYAPTTANYKLRNKFSVFCHRVCASRFFIRSFHLSCWFLLLLTFFEAPSWCKDGNGEADLGAVSNCKILLTARGIPAGGGEKEVEYYPNSHALAVSASQSDWIEFVCVALISLGLFLRIGRDGMSLSTYFRRGTAQFNRVVQATCLISIAVGIVTGFSIHHPYARLLIAMSLNEAGFQRDLQTLFRILPSVLRILFLLALIILFYAWFGTVMFLGTAEGEESFPSLLEGMVREPLECAQKSLAPPPPP